MASPHLADPTAVFGRRVIATLLDAALILIPAFLILSASFEYLDVSALDGDPAEFCSAYTANDGGFCLNFADVNDRVYFSDSAGGGGTAYYWGATLLLMVVLQGLTGRTPGKIVAGLRTVREDGSPPGLIKAFVRWVLWVIDAFPYVVPLLGPILALTTQGHRRLGDMVAKTFVVRTSAAGAPIMVPGLTGSPGGSMGAPGGPWAGAVPPSASGPQWDPVRNTYIQWDSDSNRWLQWDDTAKVWSPLPGQ